MTFFKELIPNKKLKVKLVDVNPNASGILKFYLMEHKNVDSVQYVNLNSDDYDSTDDYDICILNDYFYDMGSRKESRKEKVLRFCTDQKEDKKIVFLKSSKELKLDNTTKFKSVRDFAVRDKRVFEKIDKQLKIKLAEERLERIASLSLNLKRKTSTPISLLVIGLLTILYKK